ncbi:MAG TPA: hypothetical protein VJI98_00810 [Candidatus Nanoarchaeia archaeon]|nr:hypothetical protein [Candidatus Nanoarchaeia archaeon]
MIRLPRLFEREVRDRDSSLSLLEYIIPDSAGRILAAVDSAVFLPVYAAEMIFSNDPGSIRGYFEAIKDGSKKYLLTKIEAADKHRKIFY